MPRAVSALLHPGVRGAWLATAMMSYSAIILSVATPINEILGSHAHIFIESAAFVGILGSIGAYLARRSFVGQPELEEVVQEDLKIIETATPQELVRITQAERIAAHVAGRAARSRTDVSPVAADAVEGFPTSAIRQEKFPMPTNPFVQFFLAFAEAGAIALINGGHANDATKAWEMSLVSTAEQLFTPPTTVHAAAAAKGLPVSTAPASVSTVLAATSTASASDLSSSQGG